MSPPSVDQERGEPREDKDVGPELFIGLVSPVGSDNERYFHAIRTAFMRVGYDAKVVNLSDVIQAAIDERLPKSPEDERIRRRMDAGDHICRTLGDLAAVAALGVAAIPRGQPAPRTAYVFSTLKRPAEVAKLREIYGSWFFLVGAYTPPEHYTKRLGDRIRRGRPRITRGEIDVLVHGLISRDAGRAPDSSQNVSGTFHLADVFVDGRTDESLANGCERFVDLLFGTKLITPNRDELAMFHAYAASLRSASLSRLVGAVVSTRAGDLIATGTNEVPIAGGGFFCDGDPPEKDHRDHKATSGVDPSLERRHRLLADVLTRLSPWFTSGRRKQIEMESPKAYNEAWNNVDGSSFTDLLEYQRAVHGEMSALMDAAKRGVSVRDATLYCTTFPCHLCAKHIVAAGIERVVYIEPYPKSKAEEFYPDEIDTSGIAVAGKVPFDSFVGIAPRRFIELFQPKRGEREQDGLIRPMDQFRAGAMPRVDAPLDQNNVGVNEVILVGMIKAATVTTKLSKSWKSQRQKELGSTSARKHSKKGKVAR